MTVRTGERRKRVHDFWTTPWVMAVGLLLLYFGLPIGGRETTAEVSFGWLVAVVGVAAVGYSFYRHIRDFALSGGASFTVKDLLVLFETLLVVFSAIYFFMAKEYPPQMHGISTRIDALYFSLTTFATVGYGDITATGQVGRVIVSVQMLFDLVFVGALVSIATTSLKERAAAGELQLPRPKRKER